MSALEDYRFSKEDAVTVKIVVEVNSREVESHEVEAEAKIVLACTSCDKEMDPDDFVQHVLEDHAP